MLFGTANRQEHHRGLIYRFNVIGALTIFLPILLIAFLIYDSETSLHREHLVILAMALILMLAGLMILRHVFDSVLSVVDFLKKNSDAGNTDPIVVRQDVSDLKNISTSFAHLMARFEKTTGELDQRILELNAIREMTEIAQKTLHVEELLKAVLEKAMTVVCAKNGSIFTIDADAKQLRLVAATPAGSLPNGASIHIKDSALGHVIAERKAMIVRDIEMDPRTHRPNDSKYGAPSFLSMPVFTDHSMIAVMNLANKESKALFDEHDERILTIMLGEVGFALENAILHARIKEQLDVISVKNSNLEREIADRKRIEENLQKVNVELKEANDRLMVAYEWMRESRDRLLRHQGKEDIGFIVDRDGKIDGITERALECTGKARVELIGHNILDTLDDACHDEFKSELRQAWMGMTRNFQVVLSHSIESERIFEATLTRLTSEFRRSLLVILR